MNVAIRTTIADLVATLRKVAGTAAIQQGGKPASGPSGKAGDGRR